MGMHISAETLTRFIRKNAYETIALADEYETAKPIDKERIESRLLGLAALNKSWSKGLVTARLEAEELAERAEEHKQDREAV